MWYRMTHTATRLGMRLFNRSTLELPRFPVAFGSRALPSGLARSPGNIVPPGAQCRADLVMSKSLSPLPSNRARLVGRFAPALVAQASWA